MAGKGKDHTPDHVRLVFAIGSFIKRVGLPTAVIAFFWVYSSPAQKTEFIDTYILGFPKLFEHSSNIILAAIIGVVLGQRNYFQKQMELNQKEMRRVSKKKTDLQKGMLGDDLDHVDDDEEEGEDDK